MQLFRRLNQHCAVEDKFYPPYVLGVLGEDFEGALHRFRPEVEARISRNRFKDPLIILALGLNDSKALRGSDVAEQALDAVAGALMNEARRYSPNVIVVGPNPVSMKSEGSYDNDRIFACNALLRTAASEQRLPYVDIVDLWDIHGCPPICLSDGVHPDFGWHAKMSEAVLKAILKLDGKW